MPLSPAVIWVLRGLLVLWAALLVFGFVFGRPGPDRRNRLPLPVRMGTSAVLLLAALVWWLGATRGTALDAYGALILLGMALGFLGDLILARVIPLPQPVVSGILAFGLGHVTYIAAFLQAGRVLGLPLAPALPATLAVYLAVAAVLWALLVRAPSQPPALNAGTAGYSLLLAAMAAVAMVLAFGDSRFWPLALGGLLFVASDLVLGNQIMRNTAWPYSGDVIWTTYTGAQAAIVYSSAAALAVFAAVTG
jgi:uncharacterized membrane protein YhhN